MLPPTSSAPPLARSAELPWRAIGAGVVVLALVLATEVWVWLNLWPLSVSWGTALIWSLPQLYFWLLLLPVAALAVLRWPLDQGVLPARLALHLLGSALFSVTALVLVDLSDRVIHWSQFLGAPGKLVSETRYTLVHLHFGIAVYWVTAGGAHAARWYRRARTHAARATELEAELARTQLEALRAQLRPHFLYNTLNSIAVLVRTDPAAAEAMVLRLGKLLRSTLEPPGQEVSLDAELRLAEEYLAIEQERFRDRLQLVLDVDPAARRGAVPHLLLQPLLDNAVHHAVAARADAGRIEILARRAEGRLVLTVRDDGPGLRLSATSRGTGVGLANTRRRLEVLYGDAARLEFRSAPDEGIGLEITIILPFQVAPREDA